MTSYTGGSPAAGPGMTNPNMLQSQVVVNARYDRYFTSWRKANAANNTGYHTYFTNCNDECYDVQPRELAFVLKPQYNDAIKRNIQPDKDRELRIFTSANGLPSFDPSHRKGLSDVNGVPTSKGYDLEDLRDQLTFIGVPLTRVGAANANQSDGVSVMVAGSTTIWNTGQYEINVGDVVMWDIPTTNDGKSRPGDDLKVPGLPTYKRAFITVPLRFGVSPLYGTSRDPNVTGALTVEELLASMERKAEREANLQRNTDRGAKRARRLGWKDLESEMKRAVVAGDEGAYQEALRTLLTGWTREWSAHSKRIIGVALSNANPSEPLDILLQQRCA